MPPTTVCNNIYNVVSSGVTVKKICEVTRSYDYPTSSAYCRNNSMQLYAIRNAVEFIALKTFMETSYGATASSNTHTGLNGQQAANGTWFNFNPTSSLLYSGAIPTGGTGTFLNIQGNGAAGWGTIGRPASFASWFVCEFDVVDTSASKN